MVEIRCDENGLLRVNMGLGHHESVPPQTRRFDGGATSDRSPKEGNKSPPSVIASSVHCYEHCHSLFSVMIKSRLSYV